MSYPQTQIAHFIVLVDIEYRWLFKIYNEINNFSAITPNGHKQSQNHARVFSGVYFRGSSALHAANKNGTQNGTL